MKNPENSTRNSRSFGKCLPLALVAVALLVTGCPHDEFVVKLKPQGDHIERTLIFYREDGVNTNTGAPNYQTFDPKELAAIVALYPTNSLTNEGDRHTVQGEFSGTMPNDVGGAGAYTNLSTSLGSAGFYTERFRGNDDLAGLTERRYHAADRLADLIVGWSRMELGQQPDYEQLHRFLNVDFRRDLKNLAAYFWEAQLVNNYNTNADQEFIARFAQYLEERGYFSVGDLPGLAKEMDENSSQGLLRRIQRLVADKMGVPKTDPVPASLAFLADKKTLQASFDKYLAGTDLYRAKLEQWEKDKQHNPKAKKPDPESVVDDLGGDLIDFDLFGSPDHVAVQLSLPAAPVHSNGRWNASLKQEVWKSDIEGRTNMTHFPFFCFAIWAQPDRQFQEQHFGKVVLTGDDLTQYCLWRTGLNQQDGEQWDDFITSLQSGKELVAKLDAFRFPGEPVQAGTNNVPMTSDFPRDLLTNALK